MESELPALYDVLCRRIVPESEELDDRERQRMRAIVAEALGSKPAAVRAQLRLFLAVLRWLPVLRYGRPLDRLGPAAQNSALRWFQEAPIAKLRVGFWGVRTLIFMGYYGRPAAGAALGYLPVNDGNQYLRDG